MRNDKISKSLATVVLSLATILPPAWAQFSPRPVVAHDPGSEKTLTGFVSDSYCKGRQLWKGQTPFSCTRKCVHEEGREYVLVVGNDIYVLNGARVELDRFAGGKATITGSVSDGKLIVESIATAIKS